MIVTIKMLIFPWQDVLNPEDYSSRTEILIQSPSNKVFLFTLYHTCDIFGDVSANRMTIKLPPSWIFFQLGEHLWCIVGLSWGYFTLINFLICIFWFFWRTTKLHARFSVECGKMSIHQLNTVIQNTKQIH